MRWTIRRGVGQDARSRRQQRNQTKLTFRNRVSAKLGFQMREIVNELYLDDLREKTLRGQKGQKSRGFTVGEATYGYRSVPVGEMRADRRGRPRPDGYRMVVEASEAAIVQRVFREFSEGKAIKTIVKSLNAEGVPGRRRNQKGWSTSTVSRILKNEKYIAAGSGTGPRHAAIREPVEDGGFSSLPVNDTSSKTKSSVSSPKRHGTRSLPAGRR